MATAVQDVADALELDWRDHGFKNHVDIDAFIDRQQRHFGSETVHATEASALPSLVDRLWTSLSPGRDDPWREIARVSASYSEGADVFGPCLDEAIVEATLAHFENFRREAASRIELAADASGGSAQHDWPAESGPAEGRRPSGTVDVHQSLVALRDRLSEIIASAKRIDDGGDSGETTGQRRQPSGD